MHSLTCDRASAPSSVPRLPPFALALSLAVAMIGGLFPSAVAAAEDNVQKLLQECSAENPSYDLFHCIGYVNGIGDMMGLIGLLITKSNERTPNLGRFAFCPGKPAPTYGARLQAFKNWAQSHPEKWGDQAFVGVITALREVWPCP
jgi:hypothetical protein